MNKMNETTLIARATDALQKLGLKVLVQPQPRGAQRRADAWLRIGRGKVTADYVVEAKRAVTAGTLGAVVVQLRELAKGTGRTALLLADHLTPPVADNLRANGQQFIDAAGNAYLEGPDMLVYVTGRKPHAEDIAPKGGRTFTTNGLKILFALLCEPLLAEAPHRTIAAGAGVALGAVPGVLADLQKAGYLLVAGTRRRRLNATKQLLDEWALAYARRLRAKTLQAIYTTQNFDTWREWKLDPEQARWGGEPAAALLTKYLRPGILTIYAEKLPARLMVEQKLVKAERVTGQRELEVRKPFWGEALRAEARPDTVPQVLVYADLLATGDGRCIETAQMVYDDYLARLFQSA
jgi:hypothetical protein